MNFIIIIAIQIFQNVKMCKWIDQDWENLKRMRKGFKQKCNGGPGNDNPTSDILKWI